MSFSPLRKEKAARNRYRLRRGIPNGVSAAGATGFEGLLGETGAEPLLMTEAATAAGQLSLRFDKNSDLLASLGGCRLLPHRIEPALTGLKRSFGAGSHVVRRKSVLPSLYN